MSPLEFLQSRLSVPSRQLGAPGPDATQLATLLETALRVPDHGKLAPFRLVTVRGDARAAFGERLAAIHLAHEPDAPPAAIAKDRDRYSHAPLIVVVIARLDDGHPKVPAQEQLLSAGCVAYNLLLGAQAMGFGAQWLTGWAAYDADAGALVGLGAGECIIGFVHIGSVDEPAPQRHRPALAEHLSDWTA